MKKLILTLAIAFTTLIASAQFTVVTTYNTAAEGEDWKMSSLIDNMGIGYSLNDTWTVGLLAAGEDSLGDASYDLWGRYNMDGNMYLSVQAPTEDMMDNLTVGIGYSLSVWKGLNIEPNYSMGLKEDDNGERDGSFNLGLSYKF